MNNKLFLLIFILILIIFAFTGCININKPQESIIINNNEPSAITTDYEETNVSGDLKIYFFDVGQADAIFVQNNDSCMVIDAGNNPDGKYISKFLRKELGIKKIDYLIGTHPHEDHIGGIDILMQDFEIGTFYMPNRAVDYKSYTDVVKFANEKNIKINSPEVGTKFNVGSAVCEIMTKNDNAEEINDTSIVVQLTFGNNKFLFTGDILGDAENSRTWDDIDVLKVAHHGSTYSTKDNFLKQAKPEIAIIMCGKDNDYYYPHEAVLNRLEANNCHDVYITSKQGTIFLISDGNSISVTPNALPNTDFDGNS